jgi:drug/metabolite transporter (DMT)-like permease
MTGTGSRAPAVAALLLNALVWGTAWWPFRQLQERGLHSLWATVFVYLLACAAITLARPRAWSALVRSPRLWGVALAAGITNATFNWGVTIGEVVRVVLLFYLMPVWSALLARAWLGERVDARGWLRIAVALLGALLILRPDAAAGGSAVGLADLLGLLGGMSFAANNVLLRRYAGEPAEARAAAMFAGGALLAASVALLAATPLGAAAAVPLPLAVDGHVWLGAALLALWFLAGNLALQYGATRLAAQVTALVMLSEVVFAAASAVLVGRETLSLPTLWGGALILSAAASAAWGRATAAPPTPERSPKHE